MKWRLTGRYLASSVLIVVIVLFINLLVIVGLFIYQNESPKDPLRQGDHSAEAITRSFGQEIVLSESGMSITAQGKETLERNQAWIQVLDENGNQVYGFRVPREAKTKYTPMDIVQTYKYMEKELMSTVFIGEKQGNGERFSYLIGFQDPYLERNIFTYDIRQVGRFLQIGIVTVICVDGFIALCIAYLFSKRLTRPLSALIDGIKQLAHKNYQLQHETKGIYKDVFYNVNMLTEELRASELERKRLDRMKEEWIANISHDIKTPLASIQGYAEMMRDMDYDFTIEEMRDYAEIIEQKSHYLKDVIEDLNLSTRLRNKGLKLNLKKVNIVSLVRSAVIDTLNDARYGNRNIDFQYSEEVILLEADDILIRRAVTNLIYNAVVHNDEDVSILVSVEKKGDRARIVVEDQGKGIPKEELERIFERYYRGTHTGELHKGSGLGMAIANDIVKAHGGEIHVDSELLRGTRIEILLQA
ncbi:MULTISPECIES: HAMP domain-containing sensor histidine kinase [Paenibacillus]|uniref:histidine kinase n=2 Tax=Paenibacillus lactis TaxID=228574 RepID=G4HC03_9BACL|nr:HAMP domain-containing sensor histidine kinase [Paenibacillus lactis]EHB66684.1 integral membrane sensor signal transduction histidine kinase [Paenibacillus lactis 154]MBP1893813.1 signal transduction histidine kinase [Paenibacillus lactis]GIO92329.1 two-component sensor histidine kinase [Paenibacillus lactis]